MKDILKKIEYLFPLGIIMISTAFIVCSINTTVHWTILLVSGMLLIAIALAAFLFDVVIRYKENNYFNKKWTLYLWIIGLSLLIVFAIIFIIVWSMPQ